MRGAGRDLDEVVYFPVEGVQDVAEGDGWVEAVGVHEVNVAATNRFVDYEDVGERLADVIFHVGFVAAG